ncbi:MAG TPA: fasciclin domain-containing protein [Phycisphaerae bacterium]|nr:fasciclin domain-containing protein [Phycisphaerae bacterium]
MFANSLVRRWLPVATMVVLAGWTGLGLAQEKKPDLPKPKDVVDVAKDTDDLKTFCKLVESAGLVDTLKGKGPYTVFAPTDEAFKKLGKELDDLQKPENKAELQRILKHHVLDGQKTAAVIKTMKAAKTLAGENVRITVKDDVVMVDAAKVTNADTKASNGLIHIVDTVLMPKGEPEEQLQPAGQVNSGD